MTNETILVVDADTKSQKVLEISLKKAGYRVVITESVSQAREAVQEGEPDLIISDTQFSSGGEDGFAFCKNLKSHARHRQIPFVFLTEQDSLPEKMYGLEVGADEYLTKPVYIKEVISQVEILLQKRAHARLRVGEVEEFEADLEDVTLIDLLQTIEQERRSGSVEITSGDRRGAVYFNQGNILDALCGKLRGEDALYRLMLWPEGTLKVRYQPMDGRADHVDKDSGALLIEGIRRLEQWYELTAKLPAMNRIYEADYQRLPELLPTLPEEVGRLVRLFDGVRTLNHIVDDSPFNDIMTLQIMQRLLADGVLRAVTSSAQPIDPARRRTNLEAWLAGSDQEDVRAAIEAAEVSTDIFDDADTSSGGGHWRVRWDESTEELPREGAEPSDPETREQSISELFEREERRREEEARQLIRQSGQYRATQPLMPAIGRDAEGSRRATLPMESPDFGDASAQPRQRRMTPIAAPNVDVEAESQLEEQADVQTSPGIQVAALLGEHLQEDADEPPAVAAEGAQETSSEDDELEGFFAADGPSSAEELDVMGATPEIGEAAVRRDASEEVDKGASSPDIAADDSVQSRRAAAVDEAASLTREATQNLRESAPRPSISRYEFDEEDEDDELLQGWSELQEEQSGGRIRRITARIPVLDDDEELSDEGGEATSAESADDAEPSAEESAADKEQDERADSPEVVEDADEPDAAEQSKPENMERAPGSAAEDEAAEDEEDEVAEEDEAAEQVDEHADEAASEERDESVEPDIEEEDKDARDDKDRVLTVPLEAIEPLDMKNPAGVVRSAVDRRMVMIEYDLSQSGQLGISSDKKNPTRVEIDKPNAVRAAKKPAEDSGALVTEPEDQEAERAAADGTLSDDEPGSAASDKGEKAEGAQADGAEREGDEPGADAAAPLSEAAASEVLASAAAPDGAVDGDEEETLELERDESAAAMAEELHAEAEAEESSERAQAASETLPDSAQEESFFSDGEEGEYDWGFEDVPRAKNRWKYFTAVAILAGLTALAIAWYLGSDDSETAEQIAEQAAAEQALAEQAEAEAAQKKAAEEALAEAESEQDEARAEADEALKAADQGALAVRETAQGAALMLAGLDPAITGEEAGQDEDVEPAADEDEGAPGEAPAEEPAEAPPADSFEGRVGAAESQIQAGQNGAALRALRELSAEQSNNPKVAYLHGLAALGVGNYSESAEQLGRADSLGYGDAEMYIDLATAHQLSGDDGQAKSAYEKFLSRQPNGKRADEVRSILERL